MTRNLAANTHRAPAHEGAARTAMRTVLVMLTAAAAATVPWQASSLSHAAEAVAPPPPPDWLRKIARSPDPIGALIARDRRQKSLPKDFDKLVGQMVMVGYHGTTAHAAGTRRIADLLEAGRIGGVILMQRNITRRSDVAAMTRLFRESASPRPFISVDQEGGAVQRIGPRVGVRRIPSAARMAARYSPEQAAVRYRKAADDLARLGVNLNFGPVVDLNRNRRNPIIARKRRAYGATTADVLPYAHAFISAHRAAGVLTSAKHFPGHGSSWADSHRRFVDLTKTWDAVELAPYRALTGAAAPDMVMVGHLYHPRFSPRGERVPASLSPAAIRGVLRGKIGYRGIVITDDLEMAAVTRRYSLKERVIRAIAAGNDVIMLSDGTTRGTGVVDAIHRHVREAVLSGRIGLAQIRAAHARIIATKARLAGTRREARAD